MRGPCSSLGSEANGVVTTQRRMSMMVQRSQLSKQARCHREASYA